MNKNLDRQVRERARQACEYCHMPQLAYRITFPVDHIIAQQHGGLTVADNLALACLQCNSQKGPNLSGIDPETGRLVRLFHPRKDLWTVHFGWRGPVLFGLTPIGRTTSNLLLMNHPRYIAIRASLIEEDKFQQ